MNILVGHKVEEHILEKFWEVEAASINNTDNKSENRQFQDVYESNSRGYHMETERYVAKLPCKEEHHTLLDNRSIAQRRTENVIKRLSRELTLL
ncbi:Hypothetical predicted protein [Mytilus galloprovincialis]|uniref:Uncharacterized protein n=1 Tax=Mytilus galloprovincialis TaxID=29158 RepID=A0A8B6HAU9_MYTGA|nr:Hypothetical predicted protein [Mytilus galloprovincialis]